MDMDMIAEGVDQDLKEIKELAKKILHPSTLEVMQWFEYKHLPPNLQETSKYFHHVAWAIASSCYEGGAENTYCMRRLLEAKDCAVRARKLHLERAGE